MQMVIYEATALTLGGALAGLAVGGFLLAALRRLPQTAGILDGRLPAAVVVQALFLALLVALVGAAYPALWAANLRPVDALSRQ